MPVSENSARPELSILFIVASLTYPKVLFENPLTLLYLTLLETLPNQDTRIGYIPKGNDHSSGTTVALGFDIGQHSSKDLLTTSLSFWFVK